MRGMRLLSSIVFLVGVAGCGTPCANVSDPSGVWSRAALARVDVYDASASCDGDRVFGAAVPQVSRTFPPNGKVDLDTTPGHHTVVLTLYADAAGTLPFAGACTSGDFGAASDTCLALTLDLFPCSGVGCICVRSPDSCPSGMHCDDRGTCQPGCGQGLRACSGTCIPDGTCCSSDCTNPPGPNACFVGACAIDTGSSCTYTPVAGSQVCSDRCCVPTNGTCGSDCRLTCNPGWADCDGDSSNGCEQSLTDVNNCGACSRWCGFEHAKADCSTGMCSFVSCNSGYVNCDANTSNGCGCKGNGCCSGSSGSTCQTSHFNGIGQTFYDCAAQNTLDATQATEACVAYTGSASQCGSVTCPGVAICSEGSSMGCNCWMYTGTEAGRVRENLPGACNCSSHPNLPSWN
jgi:hypothetical protein